MNNEKKLKTLKDLGDWINDKGSERIIGEKELKAEAIKWAKEILKEKLESEEHAVSNGAVFAWIKVFFDLTKEDLK